MNNKIDIISDDAMDLLDDAKSKSQVKRELEELKNMARQLVDLPVRQLQTMSLSETTEVAVSDTKGMQKSPLKRQLRYISGLLKDEEIEVVRRELSELLQPQRQQVQIYYQFEDWRDALIEGDDSVLIELAERFEDLDRQYLMQLVRNARKELKAEKPAKAARVIFQYFKDLNARD